MPLTRSFKETVAARLRNSSGFRKEMLSQVAECLLGGELNVGKSLLRDFVNATIGFAALSAEVDIPVKSLMRMFGHDGNPQAKNLFAVIAALQADSGIQLKVTAARSKMAKQPAKPVRSRRRQIEVAVKPVRSREQYDRPGMGFAEEPRPFKRR